MGISKKIQPQKIGLYKIIDTPILVTYKQENFSGKQITRHRIIIVTFYPKELSVPEQMENYFLDNTLLKLHPKKPTIAKSKSVPFSQDNPDIPYTDELSRRHLATRLKYPNTLRKTTLQETLVLDPNR